MELLDAALQPLEGELDDEQLSRLKDALSILIGTEATIVLRDVLRLAIAPMSVWRWRGNQGAGQGKVAYVTSPASERESNPSVAYQQF
jgi:hypothetical protein